MIYTDTARVSVAELDSVARVESGVDVTGAAGSDGASAAVSDGAVSTGSAGAL